MSVQMPDPAPMLFSDQVSLQMLNAASAPSVTTEMPNSGQKFSDQVSLQMPNSAPRFSEQCSLQMPNSALSFFSATVSLQNYKCISKCYNKCLTLHQSFQTNLYPYKSLTLHQSYQTKCHYRNAQLCTNVFSAKVSLQMPNSPPMFSQQQCHYKCLTLHQSFLSNSSKEIQSKSRSHFVNLLRYVQYH